MSGNGGVKQREETVAASEQKGEDGLQQPKEDTD